MAKDVETGTCNICKKEHVQLSRKYYYYDIECDCCNSKEDDHFEIVKYCKDCEPKPPRKVKVSMTPLEDDEAFKGEESKN